METKFPFKNEVEKEMGIIEEETSDEDNSSKDGADSEKNHKGSITDKKISSNKANNNSNFKTGELTEIKKSKNSSSGLKDSSNTKTNPNNLVAEKRNKKLPLKEEEEKGPKNLLSNSFNDIRESYDFIRQHRSSSCKSAAASLQFSKRRYLTKKVSGSPFMPLSKRSHHFSTSTSKRKTQMPSLFGLGNRKMSEPSLVDNLRRVESNSKCLSDVSWNLTYLGSETKNSVPLQRCVSNSSLSSDYSVKRGNTSTTTLTSDFTWEFRSCKLQPMDIRTRKGQIDAEFPFRRRRDLTRPINKLVDTLPELIECEEKLEEEYDLFSIRHNRIKIMEDLNEFGRKGKRYRSLDGSRKRKRAANRAKMNNYQWDSDVSETEEEDWISDDSTKEKGKSLSKISRIFNKIYADHFERPIRMKQIKERSRRNIHTLGDTPINEDSNDSSDKSSKDDIISDTSSSNMSFRKKYVRTLFDKMDQPETKTLSTSNKYYEQIEDPIQEDEGEYTKNTEVIKSETYEKFKSRHERWKLFDKVLDEKEDPHSKKMSFRIRSFSFDNEPILEENDEDNELADPYYHHFSLKNRHSSFKS
jgi:hypothetical protein